MCCQMTQCKCRTFNHTINKYKEVALSLFYRYLKLVKQQICSRVTEEKLLNEYMKSSLIWMEAHANKSGLIQLRTRLSFTLNTNYLRSQAMIILIE